MKGLSHINENTSLPFKVVVPIIGTIVGATIWLGALLHEIRDTQKASWTIVHQQLWAMEMRQRNASLTVPEPLDIVAKEKTLR